MKNLMTYVNPSKKFDRENGLMAEIQIENSLNLGWKPEDIILVTNFPYEYQGIKALVIGDELCNQVNIKTSKIGIIVYLLENKLLEDLTWVHDLDSFQLVSLDLPPLDRDIAFIDYCHNSLINTGNIFFKPTALDVFRWINDAIHKHNKIDELVLPGLLRTNFNNIHSRFRRWNTTYNIGMRYVDRLVSYAEKPVKIAHFPPHSPETFETFKPLLTENLTRLINEKFYPPIGQSYTYFYYELLKDKGKIKKVAELEENKDIGDIDLVIDDSSHRARPQIQNVKNIMPRLKKECIYIIEDAKNPIGIKNKLIMYYDCQIVEFHNGDSLIIVKHKP